MNFNSHAHVERDAVTIAPFQNNHYFNSHAHVERDRLICERGEIYGISTHTLTWSVTVWEKIIKEDIAISTHTLTWSVTIFRTNIQNELYHFNSHAHVERDYFPHKYTKRAVSFQLTRSRGA